MTWEAFQLGWKLINAHCAADGKATPDVIGDFVLPPLPVRQTRDFQTLHFDFGLPLDPKVVQDVCRYTALYVPRDFGTTTAATRLVPLAALLKQRSWPSREELLARVTVYGKTHGAWDDARGYVEGSLARLIEAAAGSPLLPSVKSEPGFLCGLEFDNLRSEIEFFEAHSLCLADVQIEIHLLPGELLVFDNLALAHGRRGTRRAGELRQWVFGDKALGVTEQRRLRERVFSAFGACVGDAEPDLASRSIP